MARRRTVRVTAQARVQVSREIRIWYRAQWRIPPSARHVLRSLPQEQIPSGRTLSGSSSTVSRLIGEGYSPLEGEGFEYDLFLSYASEDGGFAADLAYCLEFCGVRVWFDETAIAVGDSLRRSIDDGLRYSRFGVVVLSNSFFDKNWTHYELDGLITREMQGKKVILPVLHPDFTLEDLAARSPSLAGRKALLAAEHTIEGLAEHLAELVLR